MRRDAEILDDVGAGSCPPTLRFYRFKVPTLSFGRLQKFQDVSPLIPTGWHSVQRPTGGGIVFHDNDLCLSLCWPLGQEPLPRRPQEQYRWIHSIILEALKEILPVSLRMAACGDTPPAQAPFAVRTCFQNPVGYDLLQDRAKITGGALRCTRRATLYQGSIQIPLEPATETRLESAFERRLS